VLLREGTDIPATPLSTGTGLSSAQQMLQAVSQHPKTIDGSRTPAHGVTSFVEDFILLRKCSIFSMQSPVFPLVTPG